MTGAIAPALGTVLNDAQWPAVIADLRQGFAGKLNVYRVMAHSPALLRAWAPLRQHVVLDSALAADLREIVILRVGHRWGSVYEWGQHVVRGRAAGLDDVRIDRARRDASHWPDGELDSLVMMTVDALLDDARAPADLIETLNAQIGPEAVIDLIATVGMYTTLAFIVRSFDTPLEAEITAELRSSPLAEVP